MYFNKSISFLKPFQYVAQIDWIGGSVFYCSLNMHCVLLNINYTLYDYIKRWLSNNTM